ncbi:hypothetical protein WR25_15889 [Diploscapter pachys]|uniref:Uncharacterized protein n=1 Tax=Diploscapter pachys TaxID=2018661 RepID=A0A2A2KEP8_9BILA|nr:hypothetical protein WR25_15889 [Diploscapter pachys]
MTRPRIGKGCAGKTWGFGKRLLLDADAPGADTGYRAVPAGPSAYRYPYPYTGASVGPSSAKAFQLALRLRSMSAARALAVGAPLPVNFTGARVSRVTLSLSGIRSSSPCLFQGLSTANSASTAQGQCRSANCGSSRWNSMPSATGPCSKVVAARRASIRTGKHQASGTGNPAWGSAQSPGRQRNNSVIGATWYRPLVNNSL